MHYTTLMIALKLILPSIYFSLLSLSNFGHGIVEKIRRRQLLFFIWYINLSTPSQMNVILLHSQESSIKASQCQPITLDSWCSTDTQWTISFLWAQHITKYWIHWWLACITGQSPAHLTIVYVLQTTQWNTRLMFRRFLSRPNKTLVPGVRNYW